MMKRIRGVEENQKRRWNKQIKTPEDDFRGCYATVG